MKKYYLLGSGANNLLGKTYDKNKYDYNEDKFNFDVTRKNDSHIEIFKQIKPNSVVLDIGCATGLIGNILKIHKNCIVDGIEYDIEAFKIAKTKKIYRNIYNFSITESDNKEFEKLKDSFKYDYIIIGDVLEHLVEPWKVLCDLYYLLKDNGAIIISLPNIANLDIIRALINDEFNYQELGIMDTTHLRFFTKNSFVDMIKNIANNYNIYYNIELCEPIIFIPSYYTGEGIYSLFKLKEKNIEDFLHLQYIFKLTKSDNNKITIKGIKTDRNYFDKIDSYIIDLYNKLENLKKQNESSKTIINDKNSEIKELNDNNRKLNDDNKKLNDINLELIKQINRVTNSKGWKLLEKIRQIKNKFFEIVKGIFILLI